jgi:uncharacterized protein YcgL (UPF0745 family)
MIIIKNHFDGKYTYIIGKLIINGCQSITIDKLEEVCKKFKVPENMKKEVMELYYKNGETENWDELAKHEDIKVRAAVAKQGYCLDILVNDECWVIRKEVAKQGYGLDILVNDENYQVRLAVAKQGFGLDKLVNDIDSLVRLEVARQGYGLDILVNDTEEYVRIAAKKKYKFKKKIK